MRVLTKQETADKMVSTALAGYVAATYLELITLFGDPTYTVEDGLDKTNFEWIIEHAGKVFSIYDWKCTEVYSIEERNLWHLGAEWRDGDQSMINSFNTEINKRLAKIRNSNERILENIYIVKPKHS